MSGDSWATPQWLFDYTVKRYGNFVLDVCASDSNKKCGDYFTVEQDGLLYPWAARNWCNPPYSNPLPWIKKAISEAENSDRETIFLLPADFSTAWFKLCWDHALEIAVINHRIKFEGATGSPKFSNMFVQIVPCRIKDAPEVYLIDLREDKKEWEATA